jgi:pyridoxamine 5'-phosphate oxidase
MNTTLQTPEEIRQHIWKELGRATHDRHHAWRTPVLATATDDGGVNARTVVLRRVDAFDHVLEIYTDHRSSKVAELTAQPLACLVFWSPRLHWQLRVRAEWSVHATGADVASRWQAVRQTRSAGDYMSNIPPGAPLPQRGGDTKVKTQLNAVLDSEGGINADVEDDSFSRHIGENFFTILQANVVEIDWLELGREGHRRAKLISNKWQWLNP